jgi:hypothetical protein
MRLGLGLGLSGPSGASSFDPVAIFEGTAGFLFVNDISTMYSDTSGTTPAEVDGPVGYWADQSGNGNHAVAPSDAERPTLKLAAAPELNAGKYYLQFSGAHRLVIPTAGSLYDANGAATIVAAAQATGASGAVLYSEANSSGLNTLYNLIAQGTVTTAGEATNDVSKLRPAIRSDGAVKATTESALVAFDNSPRVLSVVDDAYNLTTYIEDQADTVVNSYAPATFTINTVTLGAISRATPTSFWTGRLYAICGIRRVLSASDLGDLQRWMAGRCRTPKRSKIGSWTIFTYPRAIEIAGRVLITGSSPTLPTARSPPHRTCCTSSAWLTTTTISD